MRTKPTEPELAGPEAPAQLAEAAGAAGDALRGRFQLAHLRAWRNCAQLGIVPLATRAGLSTRTVMLTERGERMANPSTVRSIAAGLGIPPDILLMYSPLDEEAREYVIDITLRIGRERAAAIAAMKPIYVHRWTHRTSAAPSNNPPNPSNTSRSASNDTPSTARAPDRELCSI